jgi:hypothetical protein
MRRAARGKGPSPATKRGADTAADVPAWSEAFRNPAVLAGLALVLVSRAVFALYIPTANEDAYITFRFARHLAEGLGPVFNPGERVMGYTSPLWMLWTAAGLALHADPLVWVRLTAIAADLVAVSTLALLLDRHVSRASAWSFAVFFGCWPFFSAVAVSGLESSALFALLALGGMLVAGKSDGAGPVLGALALIRPEGTLCALVLAAWASGRARIVAALIAVAGLGILALVYGSFIPQSVMAKAVVYGTPGPLAAKYWWEWILPLDVARFPEQADSAQLWTLRLLLAPGVVAGILALRRTPVLPLAIAGLSVWALYIGSGTAYFYWYLLVPAATAGFLACAGLPRLVRGPWLAVTAALVIAGTWTYAPYFYLSRAGIEGQLFGDAASYLTGAAQPGESVLLEPIGIIGWTNDRLRLRDEVGLVTPWISERRRAGQPGWYADAVEHFRPDWLVVRAGFLENAKQFAGRATPFRDSSEFSRTFSRYRVMHFTGNPPTMQDLAVLRRR